MLLGVAWPTVGAEGALRGGGGGKHTATHLLAITHGTTHTHTHIPARARLFATQDVGGEASAGDTMRGWTPLHIACWGTTKPQYDLVIVEQVEHSPCMYTMPMPMHTHRARYVQSQSHD